MAKITTADCVKEIVALCADPTVVLAAYNGGQPADYLNPVHLAQAFKEMVSPADIAAGIKTPADLLNLLVKDTTNPKNWKRKDKSKCWDNPNATQRCFDCAPFDDQLRAYVTEENGQITEVYIAGE